MKKVFIGFLVLLALFLVTLPFTISMLSFSVLKPVLTVLFLLIYFGLIIYILKSLFFSNLREKLMAIPFIFLIGIISYIFYDLKLYYLVINQFGANYKILFQTDMIFRIFELVNPVLPIGIIISILPIVFFSLSSQAFIKPIRMEELPANFNKYRGRLKSINATGTRINKVRVYELKFDNVNFTENQIYIKKVKIPPNLINNFVNNMEYDLYCDQNDIKKCYVKIGNYLY